MLVHIRGNIFWIPDLKTLLSCANNGHMQMDAFGRIAEISGRSRGMTECQNGSDRDDRSIMIDKICWYTRFSFYIFHILFMHCLSYDCIISIPFSLLFSLISGYIIEQFCIMFFASWSSNFVWEISFSRCGQSCHENTWERTNHSPTSDRVFPVFPIDFTMLSFPSCLYLPR